jgi:amino acid adenylation domain-containing protein
MIVDNQALKVFSALNSGQPETLVSLLQERARQFPTREAFTFLLNGETPAQSWTFAELDQQARLVAAHLQHLGLHSGERALLLIPPGLDYIGAFFGCLYAGVVAVPVYPPRLNRPMPRLQAILADSQASVALTTASIYSAIAQQREQLPALLNLNWLAVDSLDLAIDNDQSWQMPAIDTESLAFLQYTSGSTASPKGVRLTHANLLQNLALIQNGFESTPDSVGVIWLPPYHDMGLIGGILQPIYYGGKSILMAPAAFLQRPLRWLEAISRYRGTISGGPDFAYDLCTRKITPEQRASLDLSSWQVAFNGAEPVRAETLERFAEAFGACGFRPEMFYPCYGLAEATLIVTGGRAGQGPIMTDFSRAALAEGRACLAQPGQPAAEVSRLVSSGKPLTSDQHILVVEPERQTVCPPGRVGEIWLSGKSIAQGYWQRPAETAATFQAYLPEDGSGPYLRTGDLGFEYKGELYISGRLKDLIIIRGRNHYPQDLESTVERSHPAMRPGAGAAFSVELNGLEQLVVVHELERGHLHHDPQELAGAVRQAVFSQHELPVYEIVFLKPGSIPKTSSGKIQRFACRESYLKGGLAIISRSGVLEGLASDDEPEDAPVELDRAALLSLSGAEQRDRLLSYLRQESAQALRVAPALLDSGQPLSNYGLDSLVAIELQHRLETCLEVVLPVTLLLDGASLDELTNRVLDQLNRAAAAPSETNLTDTHLSTYPLTAGQRALWFLYQLAPQSYAYNIANAVALPESFEITAFEAALTALTGQQPSLRAVFRIEQGEPVQEILPVRQLKLEITEAAGWEASHLEQALLVEARRPFNLEQGPLLRVSLFRRGGQPDVLMLTVHHIVADLWSMALLVRELDRLYPAACSDQPALQSLGQATRFSYGEFARREQERLAGRPGQELREYWQTRLQGEISALELPFDRPRPPVQTYQGANLAFNLSQELTGRFKTLCQREGVTLYMAVLAAFEVLLYRYTGQSDFVIGSPAAGRTRPETAGVIGYFINPVALRSDIKAGISFIELLRQVRGTVLGALDHQDYPFPTLVEKLQAKRDLSRSPLFQVMFAWQKAPLFKGRDLAAFALGQPGAKLEMGGLELESIALEQSIAQFDLSLTMSEVEGQLSGGFDYNIALFDQPTIRRMIEHFKQLLATLLEQSQAPLGQIPFLTGPELNQLAGWNRTATQPAETTLVEMFQAASRQYPANPALIFEGQRLTYRELDRRSDQLAYYLQSQGLKPGQVAALYCDRSPDLIIGLLGVLKAAAAYLPLDPAYPPERLLGLVKQSQAALVLVQPGLQEFLPELPVPIILLGNEELPVTLEEPLPAPLYQSLSCIIYTSGSTGEPKGVLLTNAGLVNLINSFVQSYQANFSDRILPLTAVSSASFVGEVLPLLTVGGAVVLPNHNQLLDFESLFELITGQDTTILSTVPALLAQLNARQESLPELRLVLSGGEALALADIDKLLKNTRLVNGYGLTETTVCATYYPVDPQAPPASPNIPIGSPIINTQLYILDEQMNQLPVGCKGELYVGGLCLALGYLNQPAQTAERFIPNPFGLPGSRLYRTGDLARRLPDGQLEYLGRSDHQVKIRGFRIELAEIEARLQAYPSVRENVVIVREDTPGNKRLVAYFVPGHPEAPQEGELRAFLKEKLPDYMIPAAFVRLGSLPLTLTGKLDPQALPAPPETRPDLLTGYAAPRNEIDRKIAGIWQAVLQVDKVGIQDNFFDLGGHSLLLARIHSQLKESFPDLTLVNLFEYPTISALAAFLSPESKPKPGQESAFNQIQSLAQKQRAALQRRKQIRGGGPR